MSFRHFPGWLVAFLLVALVGFTIYLPLATSAQTQDLLVNGGFEEAQGTTLSNWSANKGTLVQVSSPAHSGSHAATYTSSQTGYLYQTIQVQAGGSYIFSGYLIKNDSRIQAAYLRITWLDGTDSVVKTQDSTQITANGTSFQPLTMSDSAPTSATKGRAAVVMEVVSGSPTLFIDDVSFAGPPVPPTPTPTPTPLPPPTVHITGSVTLQGSSRPEPGRHVPVTVTLYAPGQLTPLLTLVSSTTSEGTFDAGMAPPSTFDMAVRSPHTLSNIKRSAAIQGPATFVGMGTLLEGDANDDGTIDLVDFGILVTAFHTSPGQSNFDSRADFDLNGRVDIFDFGLLAVNFLKASPIQVP